MLSADPHIPDKNNPQSYNRYSYVNNNPVTYDDPSGFGPCGHYCAPTNSPCAYVWEKCDEPTSSYLAVGGPKAALAAWKSTVASMNGDDDVNTFTDNSPSVNDVLGISSGDYFDNPQWKPYLSSLLGIPPSAANNGLSLFAPSPSELRTPSASCNATSCGGWEIQPTDPFGRPLLSGPSSNLTALPFPGGTVSVFPKPPKVVKPVCGKQIVCSPPRGVQPLSADSSLPSAAGAGDPAGFAWGDVAQSGGEAAPQD